MAASNSTSVAAVPTATAAETAIATSPADPDFNSTGASTGNLVTGVLNILAGTSTTAIVVRVRQGSGVAGALVGVATTHTLAAAASASIPFSALDLAANASGLYTVTVAQTAGTVAGTVNQAVITAQPASQYLV
jgi:hypothetical protein